MEHTPYGYDIIDGRAVVNDERAANIRRTCENYLSGMSFVRAAAAVGLVMSHCGVKQMMMNKRYLGDGFYPAILTKELIDRIEAERIRRAKVLGCDRHKKKGILKGRAYTKFSAPKIMMKYDEPIQQAEYAYSLIRNEASE